MQVLLEWHWKLIIKNYITVQVFFLLIQHCFKCFLVKTKFWIFIVHSLNTLYSFSSHINTEALFYIVSEKMQPFKRRQAVLFPNKILNATPHVRLTHWPYSTILQPQIQLKKQEISTFTFLYNFNGLFERSALHMIIFWCREMIKAQNITIF